MQHMHMLRHAACAYVSVRAQLDRLSTDEEEDTCMSYEEEDTCECACAA
jgi:hypothetical protein